MKNLLLSVVVVIAGLLAGCSSGSPTLKSIAVTPATATVAAGLPQAFTALGTYSNSTTKDLTATATWASSDTTVATIAGGSATTLKQGSTTISATMNGVAGNAALTVTAPVLESIAVTPANASVPVGTLTQFTATGTYSDKSTLDLTSTATWTSSNTTVATIAAGGLATALTINATPITITATSGTVSGNTGLTVAAATLTSIVIVTPSGPPPDTVTIANGTTYQFTALGLYNDGSKHNITSQVTWGSSNTAAAAFGAITGRALSVNPGQTTITATLGSLSGTATLVVTDATIQSIAVGPSSTTIAPLTTQTFAAIGTFSDGTTQNITHDVVWASNNAVATISNTAGSIGVATGVAPGGATATISATFGGMSGSAPLIVSSATLQSITVTPASAGLAVNSNLALQAVGSFSDNSTQHIETVATWSSSAPTVVAVNGNIATGESSGSAAITCQLGGVTSNAANLTVGTFTAITITPGNGTVAAGTSINLVATGTLTNGTKQDITNSVLWTSSNPSVATISNASGSYGSAAGVAPGTVTVIAAFAGQVGVASLTVTDATLSAITINPPSPIINLGDRQQFSATGKFSDGTTENLSQQVIWTSSKPGVAIINSSGAISTTGTGTTMIEAAFGSVNDTTSLTVQ